ncbi:hypothetical protein N9L26_02400 [Candidatus Pacebacteria bacterium]|nr:hypothetical protein [Candidatus Paceibacterota bacterium]
MDKDLCHNLDTEKERRPAMPEDVVLHKTSPPHDHWHLCYQAENDVLSKLHDSIKETDDHLFAAVVHSLAESILVICFKAAPGIDQLADLICSDIWNQFQLEPTQNRGVVCRGHI